MYIINSKYQRPLYQNRNNPSCESFFLHVDCRDPLFAWRVYLICLKIYAVHEGVQWLNGGGQSPMEIFVYAVIESHIEAFLVNVIWIDI